MSKNQRSFRGTREKGIKMEKVKKKFAEANRKIERKEYTKKNSHFSKE